MSSLDYLDLCRLCLVKDRVSVPIFEGEGNDLFLKIAACLPVKVAREDKLPKKICDDCVYKIELFYEFWNTTANAEKRLLQWLGEVSVEGGKQGYVSNVLNPNVMKQEQSTENRLDGGVMQQVGEHQNNMGMSMMDNMGLGIPMMMSNTNQQQQQITSVPMDTSGSSAQNVQAVPGPSSQATHNQISQNQTGSTQQEDEEESSEDEENSDDECDGDEGLPVKEESEEDPNSRTIEPTTFVNVSLACDEAGPSGLQQQKLTDMPEMSIPQPADGDPKTGLLNDPLVDPLMDPDNKQAVANRLARFPVRKFKVEDTDDDGPSLNQITPSSSKMSLKMSSKMSPKIIFDEPLDCHHCSKEFYRKSLLAAHVKTCEQHLREIYDQEIRMWYNGKIRIDKKCEPVAYRCTICEYKGPDKLTVKNHVIGDHSSTFPYECAICGKGFKRKNDLREHTYMRHNDALCTSCKICGKVFKNAPAMKAHVRIAHNNPDFKCRICKRSMFTEFNLEQHMLWHEKVNEIACPVCGMTFKRKRHLAGHMNKHEEHLAQYPCHLCGRAFTRKRHLAGHMNEHKDFKPYSCPFCGKCFRRRTAQEQHILIHTSLRPYVCNICGLAYTHLSSLSTHRKLHPGPLPPLPTISLREIIMNYIQELQAVARQQSQQNPEREDGGGLLQPKQEVID
ncbi:uncharacterized protein LOC143212765 isoform X10 [Lasioglossum baleicum]|uniref:uncharacterized protein LOC143212765 isoform X10 n=1 Tax=Lasioglossum baleicum TaxID=434251 RepID=UPI003FCEA3BB